MSMLSARPPNPFSRGLSRPVASATSTRLRIPSDLEFGSLYCDYIKSGNLFSDLAISASMRHCDQLRNHPVSSGEHSLYNIPEGSTRLMTGDRKNVMALCGSNKGGRFETDEFRSIGEACAKAEASYQKVDASFKKLTSDEKKYKESSKDSEPSPAIKDFLAERASYLEDYEVIVDIVRSKRSEMAKAPQEADFQIDPEAEMKLASPLPAFLALLLSKYRSETKPKLPHKEAYADSLSRVSAFLAACAVGLVWCGSSEREALDTLLAACDKNAFEDGSTEKIRRRRIFNFLRGMREIKGVPKKERDMEMEWDWDTGDDDKKRPE